MDLYIFINTNPDLFIYCFGIIILNLIFIYIIIKSWKNIEKITLKWATPLNIIQKTHTGSIPRLGGVSIILTTILIYLLLDNNYNNKILLKIFLCGLPFIIITFVEDLFQNTPPIVRLLSLFLSSVIFLTWGLETFPIIDIPIVGKWINYPFIGIIFFSLALTGYINGVNFIDGTNGLAGFTIIISLLCLLFITFIFNDEKNALLIIFFVSAIIGFLLINFPYGKIFLGDLGAYYVGWFTGIITIIIMSENPSILNWSAVTILSYPLIEVVFSFFRKLIQNKNPFYPDRMHLHLKLFFVLQNKIENTHRANTLTTILLSIVWLMPIFLIPWVYSNKKMIFISLLVQIFIYFIFYRLIPKQNN